MTYADLLQNTNMTGLENLALAANATTSNTFWAGMYWMGLLIVLILSSVFGFEIAMLLTFFIGLVVGIFMLYLGWITITVFGITEGILIFAVIYLLWSSNKNR